MCDSPLEPKILRLVLGDQLNYRHTWFDTVQPSVSYVLMEIMPEATYVRHHIQKILAFFLAMRAFAEAKQAEGHTVIYYKIDDTANQQDFRRNVSRLLDMHSFERFEYLLPDEYRLDKDFNNWVKELPIPTQVFDTEHFLTTRHELAALFEGKKTYLMEAFYRQMRKKHQILMDGDRPLTGQWNYDHDNRQRYDGKTPIPKPLAFEKSAQELYQTIQRLQIPTIGRFDAQSFNLWALTRAEALAALEYFVAQMLPYFGTFQDAMESNQPFLFHSRLSFLMNVKILHPLEVVQSAISQWQISQENPLLPPISMAQLEGFIRQIIGWREYMRGVYWAQMPAYALKNYFEHRNPLPDFYWTGHTKMHCLSQAINQSLDYAYAHHIQRLMITGSFALLAGVHPDAVDEWYLGIYIDAIDWVEITNTRGMSQFADGGLVGTKPYVGSANYVDKMSRYCTQCYYDKKQKTGAKACPFNSLYWHFYHRHTDKLSKNPRIGMMYQTLKKMNEADKKAILAQAERYLANINDL
jgi:deoxyribodipyrimidine photolyase-related protein